MATALRSTSTSTSDAETVFTTLTSEQWPATKAAELHDGSQVVRREERPDGGLVLAVSRELPAGVPSFLERFLPKDGRVVQTDTWGPAEDGGARSGTWDVDVPGAPARIGGTMRLEPTASGSSYVLEGSVAVKVPVIGGKAEKLLAGLVERLAAKEAELLTRQLGG